MRLKTAGINRHETSFGSLAPNRLYLSSDMYDIVIRNDDIDNLFEDITVWRES
jgi:hypothetical protein